MSISATPLFYCLCVNIILTWHGSGLYLQFHKTLWSFHRRQLQKTDWMSQAGIENLIRLSAWWQIIQRWMSRSIEVVTRTLTLLLFASKSVIPPLRTNTADSRQSGGKGLTNLSYWGGSTHLWPEWETLKALADSPLKHPLFYNPLLLSLSLCMVLKEPVKAPPQQRQWWSAGETQLNSLSLIFSLLIFSAEEWGVRRSTSSQAFLLSQICLFSPLCICVLSHRKHSFLLDHLPESYHRTRVLESDQVTPVLEKILWDLAYARFKWWRKSDAPQWEHHVCFSDIREDEKEEELNLERHSCHSA